MKFCLTKLSQRNQITLDIIIGYMNRYTISSL